MCTVTIVPLTDLGAGAASSGDAPFAGFRMACNRDERRTRAEALPPECRMCGTLRAIMPIDPDSGGTWIGVNEAGLAATLLNVYVGGPAGAPLSSTGPLEQSAAGHASRGVIVPALLACVNVQSAVSAARQIDPIRHRPFRVVLVDAERVAELRSDGTSLLVKTTMRTAAPVFFTSSGLGDELVLGPRRHLFETLFGNDADPLTAQEAFHRHSWPDRPHLSVCMRRPDARTVSLTMVDVTAERVALTYRPGAPDEPAETVAVSLARGAATK